MTRMEKSIIDSIVAVYPFIYGWQDKLESEQERVISDTLSPAKVVIDKLFKIDNMRIDLCNLKVLYEFIIREVGEGITRLFGQAGAAPCSVYDKAKRGVELAGYTLDRAKSEFEYLFKRVKAQKKKTKHLEQAPIDNFISVRA